MKGKMLLVSAILMVVATAAGAADWIRVLHVSSMGMDELSYVLDRAGAGNHFKVDMVTLDEGLPADWRDYDVLVFGLSDCYESKVKEAIPSVEALNGYVAAGGGIVWTHDSLEYGRSWGEAIEAPAGVVQVKAAQVGMGQPELRIRTDHPILRSFYTIGRPGDLLAKTELKGYSHSGGGEVVGAQIIVEHKAPSSEHNFYLTVNEYGAGRVVVNEIGHAVIGFKGEFNLEISKDECRMLVNSIVWAAHGDRDISPMLGKRSLELRTGEVTMLSVTGDAVRWESLSPEIVSASGNGLVVANNPGFATVRVTDSAGYTDTVAVYVRE
ncbi:Ig-like domain-containing protein [bacterium]|nr:Ig-like domain-containing protein [candidate division CSSED10-310 bacterium]